jgi:tol-pal system protein YbgF
VSKILALHARAAYDLGAVMRIVLVLPLVVACASPMKALREDNRRLTHTVTDLRTDRRNQDRKIRDLQHQLDELRAQMVGSVVDGTAPPPLRVEVAAPADENVVGVADDGTEIVYEGDAAAGKVAQIDPPREKTPLVARKKPPVQAAVVGERGGDAANDYRLAVELVKAGKHDEAVAALRAFIAKYPRHDYADNAQYWLGEAFYARKDYTHALTEFRTVIETYPRGNKVPDALLKVGYCYQALGQSDKARAVLEQVVNLYPKTEPAALAAKRLETP